MKKILQRFVCVVLVLMMFSCTFLSNTNNVYATGGFGGAQHPGSPSKGHDSGTLSGNGWRFILTTKDELFKFNGGGKASTFEKSNIRTALDTLFSIVVTDTTGSLYKYRFGGDDPKCSGYYDQAKCNNINNIFKNANIKDFKNNFYINKDYNTDINKSILRQGGTLDKYIEANKDSFYKEFLKVQCKLENSSYDDAVEEFCKRLDCSVDDFNKSSFNRDADKNKPLLVVEPILIYEDTAISFQDCMGNSSGTKYSRAWKECVYASETNPDKYINENRTSLTGSGFYACRKSGFTFLDSDGVLGKAGVTYTNIPASAVTSSLDYSGFGVFFSNLEKEEIAEYNKINFNYTLVYEDDKKNSLKSVSNDKTTDKDNKNNNIHEFYAFNVANSNDVLSLYDKIKSCYDLNIANITKKGSGYSTFLSVISWKNGTVYENIMDRLLDDSKINKSVARIFRNIGSNYIHPSENNDYTTPLSPDTYSSSYYRDKDEFAKSLLGSNKNENWVSERDELIKKSDSTEIALNFDFNLYFSEFGNHHNLKKIAKNTAKKFFTDNLALVLSPESLTSKNSRFKSVTVDGSTIYVGKKDEVNITYAEGSSSSDESDDDYEDFDGSENISSSNDNAVSFEDSSSLSYYNFAELLHNSLKKSKFFNHVQDFSLESYNPGVDLPLIENTIISTLFSSNHSDGVNRINPYKTVIRPNKKFNSDESKDFRSSVGVNVTLAVQHGKEGIEKINSYIGYGYIDRDTMSKASYKNYEPKKDKVTYSKLVNGRLVLDNEDYCGYNCYYAVVKNKNNKELNNSRLNKLYSSISLNDGSLSKFETKIENIYGEGSVVASGRTEAKKLALDVGYDPEDNCGYLLLVLKVTGSKPKKPTGVDLKDYELNYIYPTFVDKADSFTSLVTDTCYKKTSSHIVGCHRPSSYESHYYISSTSKYVKVSSLYGGNVIDYNKDKLKNSPNKNILVYSVPTRGIFDTESSIRSGRVFSGSDVPNVRISWAYNLIRSSFGDNIVVSSISNKRANTSGKPMLKIDDDYIKNNLGLSIGNKPSSSPASATDKRDSKALVGNKLTDTFGFEGNFYVGGTKYKTKHILNTYHASCPGYLVCVGYSPNYDSKGNYIGSSPIYGTRYCSGTDYNRVTNTNINALYKDGATLSEVVYRLNEIAYKYETKSISTGKNSKISNVIDKTVSENGLTKDSSISNPYKVSCINKSSVVDYLKFYPEVEMRAYSTEGDSITNDAELHADRISSDDRLHSIGNGHTGVTAHTVYVMGEKLRKVEPSAMYCIRLSNSGNAVSGKTISDSTAVGSNAGNSSGGLPVIYAGGNVSVNVKPNFKINMYGYALDLIETSDNNTNGELAGDNYKKVVCDGSNIKKDWGNASSGDKISSKMLKEFNTWVSKTLDSISVDSTLTVKGGGVDKVYNNFNSSIGDIGDTTATSDGVYSIRIYQGEIIEDSSYELNESTKSLGYYDVSGGYKALIKQISKDYNCDLNEAKKLFKDSGIWQSISSAIEDSKDDNNDSQKAYSIGSSNKWYDETVKTFVIRRFKKENISIKNIQINDKIDYGCAPDGNVNSVNSSYNKAKAEWYLTLYFKDLPSGFDSTRVLYNPDSYTSGGRSLQNANKSGTVLVNECYIDGADFVVPSASTHDMGN